MNERLKTHSKTQKKSADLVSNKLRIGVFQRYQMKCKSVSKKSPRYNQATIVSTDKGYCQLLSPTLRIRDYFQKRWLDAPFIDKEFGVQPQQLPDYWGLAGISSSKVPGVAGIGPKSATQLLVEFQSLEGIYENLDAVAEKWRKKLETHKEMAFLCRDIARLQTDLHIDGNLQQLRLVR